MIRSIIQHRAHRVLRAPHDALHPVNRAQVMAEINALATARADKNVLVVIRHPDHFMRHHLPDREDQIKPALRNQPIRLCRPWHVQLPLRQLTDELRRNLPQRLHIRAPVMNPEQLMRHARIHVVHLRRRHRCMRPDRRQYRLSRSPRSSLAAHVSAPACECSRVMSGGTARTRSRRLSFSRLSASNSFNCPGPSSTSIPPTAQNIPMRSTLTQECIRGTAPPRGRIRGPWEHLAFRNAQV